MGIEKPSWESLNKVCMYVCMSTRIYNFVFVLILACVTSLSNNTALLLIYFVEYLDYIYIKGAVWVGHARIYSMMNILRRSTVNLALSF